VLYNQAQSLQSGEGGGVDIMPNIAGHPDANKVHFKPYLKVMNDASV
jgi:hypothetical protein